ncbi:MAG: TonB-dependent receptor plug domain-containing protein [Akkermansiaceae bacterium]
MKRKHNKDIKSPQASILTAATTILTISTNTLTADPSTHTESFIEEFNDLGASVITGTRTLRLLEDTPIRTEQVTSAEIQLTHSTKLADILGYQNGLRMESNCQNCNTTEVRMLGLQQRYLSILNDGNANFTGLAGVYGLEQIPTGILDSVEIVKGGASALYGSNAVAGVINLIPREPQENRVSLEYTPNSMSGKSSSNKLNYDANFVAEFASKNQQFGILTYGISSFTDGLDVDRDGFTDISRRELTGGGFRTLWEPNPDFKLTLDYMHTDEDRRGGEAGSALDIPANETLITEEILSLRDVLTLGINHQATDKLDYKLSLSYSQTERDSYYGGISALGYAPIDSSQHDPSVIARIANQFPEYQAALSDPNSSFYNPDWTPDLGYGYTKDTLFNTDLTANYEFNDDHTLTFGFQYRQEKITDQSGLGRNINDQYQNTGLFLQHDWHINDQTELVYGFRADKHSKVDNIILSPRISLKYQPTHNFKIRSSIATGFRAPELFDEDLHISNVGGELEVVDIADDLEEEKSLSFSVSPEWQISDNWELEGSIFSTQLRDVFFNDISSDDPTTTSIIESTKRNAGNAHVYGAEINLKYQKANFSGEIGLVEKRSQFNNQQLILGTPGDPIDNPVYLRDFERTPDRHGVVKLSYDNDTFGAFIAGKLTGPMDVPHVLSDPTTGELIGNTIEKSDYFFTVDVGTSYRWDFENETSLTLQAGIKNLFNGFQDDLDQGAFRDPSYSYGPRFPRTVYFGAKYVF